jgi:hypothetical protein
MVVSGAGCRSIGKKRAVGSGGLQVKTLCYKQSLEFILSANMHCFSRHHRKASKEKHQTVDQSAVLPLLLN